MLARHAAAGGSVSATDVAGREGNGPSAAGDGTDDASGGGSDDEGSPGGPTGSASDGGSTGGSAGGADRGGAPACAAPSDAPGVSDDEIRIGSISSLSGPVSGLGSSSAAAARAYVAFVNANGGVCGRQVVLTEADDGTDNGRYRTVLQQLAPEIFGIAGGFALGDVGGADLLTAQALPVVNGPSGEAASRVASLFDINPGFADERAVIGKYRWLREQGATKVAISYLAVDQSRFEANLQRGLMEAAGIEVVLQKELPLSTLSYDSTARAVANSGANYLWFIADVNGEAAMARAMAGTDHDVRFAEYYNFAYGTPFAELAGPAAEGTVAFIRSLPNEEASRNEELGRFVSWMGRVAPGEALDAFAVDSWASSKAFFDTLSTLGGPITRASFVEALRGVDTFDAGGMFGAIRFGAEVTNGCVVGMRYQGGTWKRLVPASGFLC